MKPWTHPCLLQILWLLGLLITLQFHKPWCLVFSDLSPITAHLLPIHGKLVSSQNLLAMCHVFQMLASTTAAYTFINIWLTYKHKQLFCNISGSAWVNGVGVLMSEDCSLYVWNSIIPSNMTTNKCCAVYSCQARVYSMRFSSYFLKKKFTAEIFDDCKHTYLQYLLLIKQSNPL